MPAEGLEADAAPAGGFADLDNECTDARLVARMRLMLALAVLLALQVESRSLPGLEPWAAPLVMAHALYSLAVFWAAESQRVWGHSRGLHWMDVAWCALMAAGSGGTGSAVLPLFVFAILTASLRWGRNEGQQVTLVATLAFALAALVARVPLDFTRLLMRAGFLLALGHLCAHWGESQLQLRRRLALLREVSRLSNPRFGVEQTLAQVLARVRSHFGAAQCLLVLRESEGAQAWMRGHAHPQGSGSLAAPLALSPALADVLLPGDPQQLFVLQGRRGLLGGACWMQAPGSCAWKAAPASLVAQTDALAQCLEAPHVISVPVALRQGQGRLHLARHLRPFARGDALFLAQLVAQAFPVIDHIDLLDRMASEAAVRERQRLALDLHDTAVQPYIGLKLGLGALRRKADQGLALAADIAALEAMAERVSQDLRRYAKQVRQQERGESALLARLREQAAQVRDFYGVDITVQVDGELAVNDRLSAEVLQVVREGLANICKHTLSRRGEVRLQCRGGWLGIRIANEAAGGHTASAFTPRSLSERAAALGGRTHVQHEAGGRTCVHIHIPV